MELLKSGFLKAMGIVTKIELFLSEFILALLIIITVVGTLTRYFLRMPFTWIEEFQLACVIWIVFLASSAAFAEKAHVAIEIIVELLPQKVQKVFSVFIGLVSICVLLFVMKTSIEYLEVFIRSGRQTPILKIPYTVIYGIVPVSCVLMILESFHGIMKNADKEDAV